MFTRDMRNRLSIVRRPKRRIVKMLKVIFFFATSTGFLYQLVIICIQYSEYQVSTETTLEMETSGVPSISLCQSARDILKNDKQSFRGMIGASAQKWNDETVSFDDYKFNIMIRDSIDTCYYVNNSTTITKHGERLLVFFNQYLKCFKILNIHKKRRYNVRDIMYSSMPYIIVVQSPLFDGTISIGDEYHFIKPGRGPMCYSSTGGVILTPILVSNYLLPYPYKTNCFDYMKTRYYTQDNCIDQCKLDTLSLKGFVYQKGIRYASSNISGRYKYAVQMSLHRKCARKCHRVDCYTKVYSMDEEISIKDKTNFHVALRTTKFEIITNYMGNMDIYQLFLYIVGIMVFWFGIDLLSLVDFIVLKTSKLRARCSPAASCENVMEVREEPG